MIAASISISPGGFVRIFFILICCLISKPAFSNTKIISQIHDVDMGQPGEVPMIYLTTGQVVTYPMADKSFFDQLKQVITARLWFVIIVNIKREILEIDELPSPPNSDFVLTKSLIPEELYHPSILKNVEQAQQFFSEARTGAKEESQCYNRAHVWTYEWRTKSNLYSSKVWLFFTRRFIRKHKFEWWFHVAPMVHVVVNGEVKERIMDIKYAKGPLKIKFWTDIFMRDNFDCPVVEKYSDQANHPESGSCFLMKSSMYYYQPLDLEHDEFSGVQKSHWLKPEVKQAYLDAFDVTI
jgi:hypothetical protein